MAEASSDQRQREAPQFPDDPFSDIEAERLHQQIALLYVLLAETLGTPPHD